MGDHYLRLTPWQSSGLFLLKETTGLSINELTRRMFDYCLRPQVMSELVPSFSGHIQFEKRSV